ncbi:hypothetical protein [Paenibacillus amylolyticus]|uniref:hypothetical protein n=1 Tax=Paenibacillus amylolyticus TaxID=1451 RepID=UPI003D982957
MDNREVKIEHDQDRKKSDLSLSCFSCQWGDDESDKFSVGMRDGEGSKLMPLIEQDQWCIFWADGNSVMAMYKNNGPRGLHFKTYVM